MLSLEIIRKSLWFLSLLLQVYSLGRLTLAQQLLLGKEGWILKNKNRQKNQNH